MTGYRKYNFQVNYYNQSGFVEVTRGCNSITFTNTGQDPVEVNGMILYPGTPGTQLGDSRTIGGNEGEIFVGRITVTFQTVVAPQLEIIQKFYTELSHI